RSRKIPKGTLVPLMLGLPAIVVVIVSQGYPLVNQFIMSFQEFGLAQQFGQPPAWVGIENYLGVLSDPTFWMVLLRSIIFCIVCASLTMALGVGTAVLMTTLAKPVRIALQSAMLLAWATPVLSSLTVWQWLFNTRVGVVNWLLTSLGLTQFDGYAWLFETTTFFIIAGAVVIWMSVPLVVFMVYASLTQIDGEMLEAASLDGASGWERFRLIIVPNITPVLMLVGLLQIIWDFRVFTQVSVLQDSGGVSDETNVLGTYVYQVGLGQGDYGVGSALAMIMLLITLILTAGYVRQLIRQGDVS
ncbi:MAG: sugar transporter permease, partial [Microbacteriaceae bacterium]|nr:sugar transporter permease [Microbacteriaceae bacterium]